MLTNYYPPNEVCIVGTAFSYSMKVWDRAGRMPGATWDTDACIKRNTWHQPVLAQQRNVLPVPLKRLAFPWRMSLIPRCNRSISSNGKYEDMRCGNRTKQTVRCNQLYLSICVSFDFQMMWWNSGKLNHLLPLLLSNKTWKHTYTWTAFNSEGFWGSKFKMLETHKHWYIFYVENHVEFFTWKSWVIGTSKWWWLG